MAPTKKQDTDLFRLLFEAAADPHFIFDKAGVIDCNNATLQFLNVPDKKQLLGKQPSALSPTSVEGVDSLMNGSKMEAIARRDGWHRFEWQHEKFDGTTAPVEVTLNAIDIDGRPGFLCVWHDLTEHKRREQTLIALNAELESANAKLHQDLAAAAAIQRGLLPKSMPDVIGVNSKYVYLPCDELGGDFLNVFKLNDTSIGFYMLDVSGHGVPAALLSVSIGHLLSPFAEASIVRRQMEESRNGLITPQKIAAELNKQIDWDHGVLQLVTMLAGTIDRETCCLRLCSAGHPPCIIVKSDGHFRKIEGEGIPLGVSSDASYSDVELTLDIGDKLILYSDGVTEAKDSNGVEFGLERLAGYFGESNGKDFSESVDSFLSPLKEWVTPGKFKDDVSLLGFEIIEQR
ncbi:MAG: SpoIIE family protein phosphatase [Pseudomonadota bacterium]